MLNCDEAFIGLERTLLQQCSSGHLGTPLHLRSKGGMPKQDNDSKTVDFMHGPRMRAPA